MSRAELAPPNAPLPAAAGAVGAGSPEPRYVAGIVQFGADPGLLDCVRSLQAQSVAPMGIVVVDHDGTAEPPPSLSDEAPDLLWWGGPNRGYAAGANRVLALAADAWPQAEYVLLLNPDVILEPAYAECLASACRGNARAALAGGKLLRPGGELIDSAGIVMDRSRRFRDRGSEEKSGEAYGALESVPALSGAALWLCREALPELSLEGEIFDEDFFSYHEDTDLAWRARRLGFEAVYVPGAVGEHRRGWRREGRSEVPQNIRRHSFKNRYLEMIKNDSLSAFLRDLPAILSMEAARLLFALFADRAVLPGYIDAARLSGRAWKKRRLIQSRVDRTRGVRSGIKREI